MSFFNLAIVIHFNEISTATEPHTVRDINRLARIPQELTVLGKS